MKYYFYIVYAWLIGSVFYRTEAYAQNVQVGFPVVEEYLRRQQLNGDFRTDVSFLQRSIELGVLKDSVLFTHEPLQGLFYQSTGERYFSPKWILLPVIFAQKIHSGGPYPEVSQFLQSKGYQSYLTTGVAAEIGPLSIRIQPELIYAQNAFYETGASKSIYTEYLERFGEGAYQQILPGQSSIKLNFGPVSMGASTENISWGPGQFNSLLFSHNAYGFNHLTLNTRRPLRTIVGSFEAQIISGRLEGSNLSTSNLMKPVNDWRYLNGINLTYQPKWLPGLFIGASRVFQQYNNLRENSFQGFFPIFEVFQKKNLFDSPSNSVTYDSGGQDQQLSGFMRYYQPKAKMEIYFEYGRRDHAYNWREAILNPEHARAYLFGFVKLIDVPNDAHIQIRGEMVQQQESINMLIRYAGITGGSNWGGHSPVRHGFTHRGQMLGPGIGPSSNVQTLETSWVKGVNKLGVRLERLNRHQDIYIKKFNDPSPEGRWVDWSMRLLADWKFDQIMLSSQLNFVNSTNYQWDKNEKSTIEFPLSTHKFSFHTNLALVYFFNKPQKK